MELIDAAGNGDIIRVRELLDGGVYPNTTNDNGETALMVASREGYIDIVRLLLDSGADLNIKNNYGVAALIYASRNGHTDIVRLLLDSDAYINIRNKYNDTALIMASRWGHTQTVKILLEHNANPNIKDGFGRTALIYALRNGHTGIVRLIREHIDLQRSLQDLAVATSFIPRLEYDTPLRYLDNDTLVKVMSSTRPYNPSVGRRIREEQIRIMLEQKEKEENATIANYLNTLDQYGSGKRKKKKTRKRLYKRY